MYPEKMFFKNELKIKKICSKQNFHLKNKHRKLSTEKRKDNQRSVEPSQRKERKHITMSKIRNKT